MQRKIRECSEKSNDVGAGETEGGDWPTSAAPAIFCTLLSKKRGKFENTNQDCLEVAAVSIGTSRASVDDTKSRVRRCEERKETFWKGE
jgi:hypothetical protein